MLSEEQKLSTQREFTVEIEKLYRWISNNIQMCKEKRFAIQDMMDAEKWIMKAIYSPNHYNFGKEIEYACAAESAAAPHDT